MICRDRRYVFIPRQKTGSTSIRKTLEPYGAIYDPCPYHVSVRWCLVHAADAWREARLTFSVIRNPWDLWVSWYFSHGPFLHLYPNFREFVLRWETWWPDFSLQYGGQLPALVDHQGRIAVGFLARFEQLQDDWRIICDRLRIRPPPALPQLNKRLHPHYMDLYDDETKAIIGRIAEPDVKRLGYTFEGSTG